MARRRPLYFRLLRVRHLRAGPVTTFLLFEGSIAVAVLLAFAEVVAWYGAIAIPITVAIMVKIHDRVARALTAPVAIVQLSATPRLRDQPKVGRSPVGTQSGPLAVGVAPVPALGRATVTDPQADAAHHNPSLRDRPRPRDTAPLAPPTAGSEPSEADVTAWVPAPSGPANDESDAERIVPTGSERSEAAWLRGNQGHFSL